MGIVKRVALIAIALTVSIQCGVSAADDVADSSNKVPSKRRLNVLFIVSDDLRPELGCYGNSIIKSPNIDKLASTGLVFERAYCQQAVCSPSRTSVMTGTRPDTAKVWDLKTHFRKALPDVVTLPQHFKQNGYETQGLGKIYHGTELDDPPSWSIETAPVKRRKRKTKTKKKTPPKDNSAKDNEPSNESKVKLTKTGRGGAFRATDDSPNGGSDGEVADQAIAALRRFKSDSKPFFLAVGFRKPHLPFNVPKHYWDMYDADKIPMASNRYLPKNAPEYSLVDKAEVWNYSGVPDTPHFPDDYARKMKHGYYASVSYMDAQLGRVISELDTLGMRDNTIIVLWGDHGWKLGEHDRWAKHSNVEIDARAPLIVSFPGMEAAGRKTKALVEFVDIYPTLAFLAGLSLPDHLEGTGFAPLLFDPEIPWKRAAFSQYPRTYKKQKLMGYSMRTDRYRFTRWVDRDDHDKIDALELYDQEKDPDENVNIANDPAYTEIVAKLMRQSIAGWQKQALHSKSK